MEAINFSYNWNNKLQCNSFTTLRLKSNKYQLGKDYEIILSDKKESNSFGPCKIEGIRNMRLEHLNEYIARIDTGYGLNQCVHILKTMYKSKNINWEKQELSLILLTKIKA